jgi:23S rRNA pseudouridine1911/1915/1917 synthase
MNTEEILLDEDGKEELYEHYRYTVDKGQEPTRIDKFLMDRIERVSRNKLQNAMRAGNVLVNQKPVKPNYRIKPKDEIVIVLAEPAREFKLIAENIPIEIVYEDDEIILVNKPPGMVVHPGFGNYSGTLVNALMYHFQHLPMFKEKNPRPGLVHRIDKDTSGTLLLAKNEVSLAKLAKQFFDRTTNRKYVALVWGDLPDDTGRIEGYIGRHLKDRMQFDCFEDESKGKWAATNYSVIERFRYVTLVECKLETGRTHQIRVHFKHIGHPLFNDHLYGGDKILRGTTFAKYKQFVQNCFDILPRQALHAKSLGFIHPTTGKEMFFDSELPADMIGAIEKWRTYSTYVAMETK